jgi:hypothetical protein
MFQTLYVQEKAPTPFKEKAGKITADTDAGVVKRKLSPCWYGSLVL